jgi:hypothetical protein
MSTTTTDFVTVVLRATDTRSGTVGLRFLRELERKVVRARKAATRLQLQWRDFAAVLTIS